MDFRVGKSAPVGSPAQQTAGSGELIEAKVLAVRQPRARTGQRRSPERRQESQGTDPLCGKILVLMIPDGAQLPQGVEKGGYRVLLRFVRR